MGLRVRSNSSSRVLAADAAGRHASASFPTLCSTYEPQTAHQTMPSRSHRECALNCAQSCKACLWRIWTKRLTATLPPQGISCASPTPGACPPHAAPHPCVPAFLK